MTEFGWQASNPILHCSIIVANRAATEGGGILLAFSSFKLFLSHKDHSRVENSGGIQASLSGRYATALFELAREKKGIDSVSAGLALLAKALEASADLRALMTNPVVTRDVATKSVAALAKAMKLDKLTANFIGVLAQNRRLGELSNVIRAFNDLASAHRGETTAEVTSAHKLEASQITAIKKQLKAKVGRDVAVVQKVDPAILGGLVIKIGSQMIDSSIKTRLNTLAVAMKG
jgi:F-type H+-transporting ATPase subunit delta